MKAITQKSVIGVVALVVGLIAGMQLGGSDEREEHVQQLAEEQAEVWTCSMHPQIRMPEPGQCPICAMDLIPVPTSGTAEELGPRQLRFSPSAQQLASIQTAPVERRFAPVETRMVGKIAVDETQISYITAWVAGRIDRLYVDYTGVQVAPGDHVAYLYSPELLTAQEELIQALRVQERLGDSGVGSIAQIARATVEASRDKLRLLGLKKEQVERIERERKASDHLTIFAQTGGVVVEKHLSQGAYVQTGSPIYTIADLSRLWLEMAAYESDLAWIHFGQEVQFTTEAYPGETFAGRISFIDPLLDERTRTVRVRVSVPNEDHRLKPGMLARATVRAQVAADGRVMDPDLAGKWISPMHPEIVRDGPGVCDVCGMDLVRAEELGYLSLDEAGAETPLVIPASAPLLTGKRAVVYIALGEGLYEGREIVLGPRAGDYYLVRAGLHEGEQVVVNGAFKIDSALQIRAKPSMMNPQGGGSVPGHNHGGSTLVSPAPAVSEHEEHAHGDMDDAMVEKADMAEPATHGEMAEKVGMVVPAVFVRDLQPLFAAYFAVQQALSKDHLHGAHSGARALVEALDGVTMDALEGSTHRAWMAADRELRQGAEAMRSAGDIAAARQAFASLSTALTEVARGFGVSTGEVHVFYCPMSFDNEGAVWLQQGERTQNPYFGSKMYGCGSRQETFNAAGAE